MTSQGSPLIKPTPTAHGVGQISEWIETPEGKAERIKAQDDADWEYWHRTLPHAVEFSKAIVKPDDTMEDKQKALRATLDTMTTWLRSE